MKNLIAVLLFALIFTLTSGIYAQQKQYRDVYMCNYVDNKIMIDENLYAQDTNIKYEDNSENCNSLAEKYIGKDKTGSHFFYEYQKSFSNLTRLKIGDEFYVSTANGVFKSKIIGYQLWFNGAVGYEFNPVLENTGKIKEDTNNYDKNIFICSKYKKMSKVKYDCITDNAIIKSVTNFLKDYTKNITVDLGDESQPVTKVIEGNFLNTDRKEYAVSYQGRISFEKFVSGVFIVNELGKVAKTVVKFNTDNTYSNLLGIVDYNGDGQYELIIESGYYEGCGYELDKLIDDKYEAIAAGFYWGA
jgi:hypothetical protein